jgi:hypothetical protein
MSIIEDRRGPLSSITQVINVLNILIADINQCLDEIDGSVKETYEAGASISTFRVVYMKSDGTIEHADKDASIDFNDVLGFTTNNAIAGEDVEVILFGKLAGAALGSISDTYWLGNNGQVVTTAPTSGIVLHVGTQTAASDVTVKIGKPLKRA